MYKIGEAAKLLGLSTEALRYYERKGLIHPHKDDKSHYRYFDAGQINHLLNLQSYQKIGFTLQDMMELFQKGDVLEFCMHMKQKQREVYEESVQLSLRLHTIHMALQNMQKVEENHHQIHKGLRPAMVCLPYMEDDELLVGNDMDQERKHWLSRNELQFLCAQIKEADAQIGNWKISYGFGMYQEIAEYLQLASSPHVCVYEECEALIVCVETDSKRSLSHIREEVAAYMEKHGLKLHGDILSQVMYSCCQQDHSCMCHLVWIPYIAKL